jgi:hypothetical protein
LPVYTATLLRANYSFAYRCARYNAAAVEALALRAHGGPQGHRRYMYVELQTGPIYTDIFDLQEENSGQSEKSRRKGTDLRVRV